MKREEIIALLKKEGWLDNTKENKTFFDNLVEKRLLGVTPKNCSHTTPVKDGSCYICPDCGQMM